MWRQSNGRLFNGTSIEGIFIKDDIQTVLLSGDEYLAKKLEEAKVHVTKMCMLRKMH